MISVTARLILLAAAAWPIASPSPKLWTPMPTAIRSASCLPGGQPVVPAAVLELVDRSRARADERRRAPARAGLHPFGVVDERHQAEREPGDADRGEPREPAPVARVERGVDRLDRTREDIPEQKDENPGRERGQAGARGRAELHPPDRHPEEDRRAGDRPEQENMACDSRCKGNLTGTSRGKMLRWRKATRSTSTSRRSTSSRSRSASTRRTAPDRPRSPRAWPRCSHVSRASAGEMLKRLEAEGLIERGARKEALLTPSGRERAERVVRKHRIIERLAHRLHGLHRLRGARARRRARRHVHRRDGRADRREARPSRPLPARLARRSRRRAGGERRARRRSPR